MELDLDVSLVVEDRESLTHRYPTDSKELGSLLLIDPIAGSQSAGHDLVPEIRRNLLSLLRRLRRAFGEALNCAQTSATAC